eukprot:1331359-Heterocapsa_arctica.AAC.1
MGGHWVFNPVSRPILPHPDIWTLTEILELHSAPLEELPHENVDVESITDPAITTWPCVD